MKKKGFTLVELLAVIAILAILVIIALPNVMGMFNQAKKNSFATELKNIYQVAQQQWMTDSMMSTASITYARANKTDCAKHVDLSGRTELNYIITIEKDGSVSSFKASDGTYKYESTSTKLKIEDIKNDDVKQIDGSTVTDLTIACP